MPLKSNFLNVLANQNIDWIILKNIFINLQFFYIHLIIRLF